LATAERIAMVFSRSALMRLCCQKKVITTIIRVMPIVRRTAKMAVMCTLIPFDLICRHIIFFTATEQHPRVLQQLGLAVKGKNRPCNHRSRIL